MLTARFHPANWLVRLSDDGAFIKFRSYLNSHFPDQELTAVFIPHSEIRGARRIVGKQEVPELDDNNRPTSSSKTIKRVELELAGDSNSLAGAVDRERRYVSEGNARLKIISRYHHLPVRLPTADKLQIEWEVVPCAGFFLNALSRRTPVHDAENILTDFVNLEKLSREEQENRLRQLAESGDKLGAIAVARRLYACDLTQAKDLVEGLVSKRSSQAS